MVDKILVRPRKTVVDDPMEVAFFGCEPDIDPVFS